MLYPAEQPVRNRQGRRSHWRCRSEVNVLKEFFNSIMLQQKAIVLVASTHFITNLHEYISIIHCCSRANCI
jgi:hypothetical protein